jgi:hypothetical protein
MNLKFVICGLALLAAATAPAQVTKSGSGFLLRMKFIKGQTLIYDLTGTVTQRGRTLNFQVPMVVSVKDVAGGVGTLEQKVGPFKADGRPMGPVRTEVLKRDARGTVLNGSGSSAPGLHVMTFPAAPLKAGGTWSAKTKGVVGTAGQMEMDNTYKIVGLESVSGRQCLRIGVTVKGTGNAALAGGGDVWIAVSDGSMVKSTSKMNVTIGKETAPMSVTITRK